MNIKQIDRDHIWHPYTQYATAPEPLLVESAIDALLNLENGEQVIDAVSSWWVNIHGHSNQRDRKSVV